MVTLPPQVADLARRSESCKILTTINEDGTPHSIVCGALLVPNDEMIGVGQTWMGVTGSNIERDPRAEFVLYFGAQAYTVQCIFRKKSENPEAVNCINEKLDRINLKVTAVWFFDVLSVRDEGLGPNVGTQLV